MSGFGAANAASAVTISVTCGEYVVPHGRCTVGWLLVEAGGLRSVLELEAAEVVLLELRPRTVREQQVTVRVPVGAELERVESTPRPVEADALSWLLKEQRGAARRVTRTRYRVGADGQLARLRRPAPG